jgi:hypothetical protein
MRLPRLQFRLRTLVALVALAALMVGGVVELIKYYDRLSHPEGIRNPDGTFTLYWDHFITFYVGPFSIGPFRGALPIVIFDGVAVVLSVTVLSLVIWAALRYRRKRARTRIAERSSQS